MTDPRATLVELLARYAYRYDPAGFRLASGKTSHEYLDCRAALGHPEALAALGEALLAALRPEVQVVGGLTMGADPLAHAVSQASAGTGHPVRWLAVRKTAKAHGRRLGVEGAWSPGDRVAVVDDVVTTGGSTIQALERVREAGLDVVQVIALVDREEGGLDRVREAAPGVPIVALVTKSAVRAAWELARNASEAR